MRCSDHIFNVREDLHGARTDYSWELAQRIKPRTYHIGVLRVSPRTVGVRALGKWCSNSTGLDMELDGQEEETYKVKDSFHWGFRVDRMVLVFCLLSFLGSGISFSFT